MVDYSATPGSLLLEKIGHSAELFTLAIFGPCSWLNLVAFFYLHLHGSYFYDGMNVCTNEYAMVLNIL